MTYAGVCYDGPCEGESRVSETRYFYIARMNPVSQEFTQYTSTISYLHHTYRWSAPLRKWVFES